MRQIFLDTETTGLSPQQGHRLVELGGVEMVNRRLTGQSFQRYMNPGRASDPEALKIHGLTEAFLADKPGFEAVAQDFLAFVAGAELIIHNAPFDVGFIDAELARLKLPPLAQTAARITDSVLLAREIYPGKANSLDALCRRLEVDLSGRALHGALLDAGLLAEAFIRMTRGQDSLVAESGAAKADAGVTTTVLTGADFSALDEVAVAVDEAELQAHRAILGGLKKPVWAMT